MQAGTAYTETHNIVVGVMHRNICAAYGPEVPKSQWETRPKVVENNSNKILWDFKF